MSEKKLLKSEKIRMKNDQLRAQGVNLEKKWGKNLVNSGLSSSAMAGAPGTNPTNLEIKGTNSLENVHEK